MAFKTISGLLYNGLPVGYDDGAVVTPTPTPTPTPDLRTTYPVSKLTREDKFYLYRMVMPYKSALKNIPGTHQIHFDVLTDNFGRGFSDGIPQPVGTVNDPILKTAINQAINYAGMTYAAECMSWDINSYTGPLKEIVQNLINKKLGKV